MATARNTLATIIAHHYVASAAQVEQLAHERYTSNTAVLQADETYLRITLQGCLARLGKSKRRANRDDQLTVLEEVNKPFYDAVLRGVTTADIAPEEGLDDEERDRRTKARNSRSGFARSSKSTLKTFIEAGGDLRALDVETVTKSAIRAMFAPPEPTDKVARQLQRSGEAFMRALIRQARASPETAQATAEAFVEALQKAAEGFEDEESEQPQPNAILSATPTPQRRAADTGHARTRVGVPTFRVPGLSLPT